MYPLSSYSYLLMCLIGDAPRGQAYGQAQEIGTYSAYIFSAIKTAAIPPGNIFPRSSMSLFHCLVVHSPPILGCSPNFGPRSGIWSSGTQSCSCGVMIPSRVAGNKIKRQDAKISMIRDQANLSKISYRSAMQSCFNWFLSWPRCSA